MDGKRNGWGKLTKINGEKYEGYWLNNKKNGRGKYIWPNGEINDGIWEDDKWLGTCNQ